MQDNLAALPRKSCHFHWPSIFTQFYRALESWKSVFNRARRDWEVYFIEAVVPRLGGSLYMVSGWPCLISRRVDANLISRTVDLARKLEIARDEVIMIRGSSFAVSARSSFLPSLL